jgi:hypothetical protein
MMNDLLALLGQAWPRLLLYPGGICALALLWLWLALHKQQTLFRESTPKQWLHCVPALVVISLLPVRGAVELGQSLDLFVALFLVEWPLFIALSDRQNEQTGTVQGSLLQGYSLLLPSLLLLADLNNSLLLGAQAASPPAWLWEPIIFRWIAALAWLVALFPLAGLGPFRRENEPDLAAHSRILGHLGLISLPLLGLLHERVWLMPLVPIGLAVALYVGEKWLRSQRLWTGLIQGGQVLVWLSLVWLASQALLERAL